jgi:hypothetical protein
VEHTNGSEDQTTSACAMKEWKNGAECHYAYRITQGKGTVYDEQYTLTIQLNAPQMDSLRRIISERIFKTIEENQVYIILEAALLSKSKTQIEKK